jgi:excisionase family DNA binding protein
MTGRSEPEHPIRTGESTGTMPRTNAQEPTAALILLTVEEAAERLRIGRTSMYRLVAAGAVESVTVGRLRRVPIECLTEYVNRLRSGVRSNLPAA